MAAQGVIGAILLAAGGSRRFGPDNKLLADVGGRPMVAAVAEALLSADMPVLAVLGHEAERVEAVLRVVAGPELLTFVHAPDWADGMGASLSRGAAAAPAEWDGVLVALGDMPDVDVSTLRDLARAVTGPQAVAVPVYGGQRGNPVAFGRAWLPRLAGLTGDRGARRLIAGVAATEVPAGPGVLRDFDTPEALGAR